MQTQFSTVVSCRTKHPDGFADGDGDGSDHPSGAISFEIVPLLGGFCARLNCPKRGWKNLFGASQIRLTYFEILPGSTVNNVEIYTVESGQNFTLQKTVLGLEETRDYRVRFLLINADNVPVFASTLHDVKTLSVTVSSATQ
jgi:hypothetical protein